MRILIDTSLLVEGSGEIFDLGRWLGRRPHEVLFVTPQSPNTSRASLGDGFGQATTLARTIGIRLFSLLESVPLDSPSLRKGGGIAGWRPSCGKTVPLGDGLSCRRG